MFAKLFQTLSFKAAPLSPYLCGKTPVRAAALDGEHLNMK